jgi:hypothetical protein
LPSLRGIWNLASPIQTKTTSAYYLGKKRCFFRHCSLRVFAETGGRLFACGEAYARSARPMASEILFEDDASASLSKWRNARQRKMNNLKTVARKS